MLVRAWALRRRMGQAVQRRGTEAAKRENAREGGGHNRRAATFGTAGRMRWTRRAVGARRRALRDALAIYSLACELL